MIDTRSLVDRVYEYLLTQIVTGEIKYGDVINIKKIADELGISQPNASQHLAVMRAAGVVESERTGREVFYRLADPDVVVACAVMRGVLMRRLARLSEISDRAEADDASASSATPLTA